MILDFLLLRFILKTEPGKPKEILNDSCEQIAEAFTSGGYRYLKSKRHLVRESDGLRYEVTFQTSRMNTAGAYVQLEVSLSLHAGEKKSEAKMIACADLGELSSPATEYYWNLVFRSRRKRIIKKVIKLLNAKGIPWLEACAENHKPSK